MRALRAKVWLAAAAALFSSALSRSAPAATPCGRPDLVDMVPADGASAVPLDARLGAHYAPSAQHLGEPVVLIRVPASGPPEEQTVAAQFDSSEGLLFVDPPAPLAAESDYVVQWPVLRGLNAAAPGNGGEARFSTGAGIDTSAPAFDGITHLEWDLQRTHSDCDDAIEERLVFDLDLAAPEDDGGTGSLSLLVFQTAGPNVGSGSTPVLARAFPPDGRTRIALTVGDSVGRVCFAALVRDATGKTSQSGDRETCIETTEPPFFDGCAIAPPARTPARRPAIGVVALLALAGAAIGARRARGRRRVREP